MCPLPCVVLVLAISSARASSFRGPWQSFFLFAKDLMTIGRNVFMDLVWLFEIGLQFHLCFERWEEVFMAAMQVLEEVVEAGPL